MDNYDDENFDDGFNEAALAKRMNFGLWRKLFVYVKRYPRDLTWLGIFAFTTAAAEVSYPLITKWVVDDVDVAFQTGGSFSVWPYIVAYAACTAVICMSIGGFIWMGGKIRTHVSHDIRRDGFENLQRLSFSFYDYRPVGWLMARMTSHPIWRTRWLRWSTAW